MAVGDNAALDAGMPEAQREFGRRFAIPVFGAVGEHDPERNVAAPAHPGEGAAQRPRQAAGFDTCAPGLA